ncbi:hypothetical protein [Streptomyces sp. NPDC008150]|uniref:hypothetical protein n=1 Tax=Streptomyces sp. NPDC008150 TaxID=3364816 RepID=UPI0036E1F4AD
MDEDWFEDHDGELDPPLTTLVEIVREAARTWPDCPPDRTTAMVFPPELDEGDEEDEDAPWPDDGYARYDAAFDEREARGTTVVSLLVDIVDERDNLLVKVLGATVAGDWMLCSERDVRTLRPVPSQEVTPLETTGTPEELGRLAADWFTEVMLRPMVVRSLAPSVSEYSFTTPGRPTPGDRWVRNAPAER